MVAGDHDDLAGGRNSDHPAELLEERACRRQRLAARAVAQLEHVARQHHAVGVTRLLQQRCAQLGAAQQVNAA